MVNFDLEEPTTMANLCRYNSYCNRHSDQVFLARVNSFGSQRTLSECCLVYPSAVNRDCLL